MPWKRNLVHTERNDLGELKLYRASAGSGKTFRLARDYVLLIIKDPEQFRHILAVTFTNKAADEMKARILLKLHEISSSEDEIHYTAYLVEKSGLTASKVREMAGRALKTILHQYSGFAVQTIDSFFQKVIRSFIRELGLPYNYSVELDHERVLEESIDSLLREADDSPELGKWLISFARMKIAEGNSWNFRKNLLDMGQEYFTEKVKAQWDKLSSSLSERTMLGSFKEGMNGLIDKFQSNMQEMGHRGLDILELNSLEADDFRQKGKGVGGFFEKIASGKAYELNSYVRAAVEDENMWFPKSSEYAISKLPLIRDSLRPLLQEISLYAEQNFRSYYTARLLIKQVYSLGVFYDLVAKIREYSKERNSFLISEASTFLWKIIANNDAPFIYEKTGSFFNHFLLDEFQDTSVIQWANFRPLIENSIAQGYSNLVVGDIKQSVYRWRNSDWKIMAGLKAETESLELNFRSCRNIVAFNNSLFMKAPEVLQKHFNADFNSSLFDRDEAEIMQGRIIDLYHGQAQESSKQAAVEEGYVSISFIEGKEWKDESASRFTGEIGHLLERGVLPGEIAVLVRDRKDSRLAVEALMKFREGMPGSAYSSFTIVSNDSLYLQNSPAVRFLLSFFSYFLNSEDKVHLAGLYIEHEDLVSGSVGIMGFPGDFEALAGKLLSDAAINEELQKLKMASLAEMAEGIIRLYSIGKDGRDIAYIQAFMDIILKYSNDDSGDLSSFLDWWEKDGYKSSLKPGDDKYALRVLTVHKAKGLEFPYLFIPFASWKIDNSHRPVIWCQSEEKPFRDIPLLPVVYSSTLKNSLFEADYLKEKLDVLIDNINLLYVALTRSEKGLWIYGKEEKKLTSVAGLIKRSLLSEQSLPGNGDKPFVQFSGHWNEEKDYWELGSLDDHSYTERPGDISFNIDKYQSWPARPGLRLKQKTEELFSDEKLEKLDQGRILHRLFEDIVSMRDIDVAIDSIASSGRIALRERDHYRELVKELTGHPAVSAWFDGSMEEIKTEAEILLPGGDMRRPDRVMISGNKAIVIDYKFGELKKEGYRKQLMNYKKLLEQMGYRNVEAYIWYAMLGELEAL